MAQAQGSGSYEEILGKIKQGALDREKIQRGIVWNSILQNSGIRLTPRQLAIYATDCEQLLIAGSGGSGKSLLLATLLLKYMHVKEHAALGVRKTFGSLKLPGGLLDRVLKLVKPSPHSWNGSDYMLRFPSGSSIKFIHLSHAGAETAVDSAEFGTIGIDESAHIMEKQIRFLALRLRQSLQSSTPLRFRLCTNPGGLSHHYHVNNFVKGPLPYAPLMIEDNTYIDKEAYHNTIRLAHGEGSLIWQQRSLGMWIDSLEDSIIPRELLHMQTAPFRFIPGAHMVRAWDLAGTKPKPGKDPDYAVGTLGHLTSMDLFEVLDVTRGRFGAARITDVIVETARRDGPLVPVVVEQEPGSSGKIYVEILKQKLPSHEVIGVPSSVSKKSRWSPFAAAARNSSVYVALGPWNKEWYDEVCSVKDHEAPTHDDQLDSVSLAYNQCMVLRGNVESTPRVQRA
jgi:predicted phage terminase large subunit-like protein